MVFSSAIFIFLFLPAVLFGYYNPWARGRRFRNVFLLAASLFFYAWGEPFCVWMLLASMLVNWRLGLMAGGRRGRLAVALAAAYNVGMLFVYKYLSFTLENLGWLLNRDWGALDIALPIGISFYSFQAMSYVIDVYRKKASAQESPLNVGLYVALFPQLVAGPIVRYETIAEQINRREENWADFSRGVCRFIVGFAKKILLANQLGFLADRVFALPPGEMSVATAWLGIVAYAFQIYFDFSGYSDMAIGLGRMFGFHFLENFNYPYVSRSITEFWRRWHISLSTWFRDYVYFPMGGSRVDSRWRLAFNLLVVWMLTGIWHGANWTFVAWGAMYFALLTLEKLTGWVKWLGRFGWFYATFFVLVGWVVFRSESLGAAGEYLKTMLGGGPAWDALAAAEWRANAPFFALAAVCATPLGRSLREKLQGSRAWSIAMPAGLVALLVLAVAAGINQSYNPFIYFNF
jgi:alginate O-acetyltransferase complex protein AlgI